MHVIYGCEFSLSLDQAVKLIDEDCVAVTEVYLGFFDEPNAETLRILKECGFERCEDDHRDALLAEFDS